MASYNVEESDKKLLKTLSEEFDSLGLLQEPSINSLEKICLNSLNLIKRHRKTLNQVRELQANVSKLKEENLKLSKQMCCKEIDSDEKTDKITSLQQEKTLLNSKIQSLQEENEKQKKNLCTLETQWTKKINLLTNKYNDLEMKLAGCQGNPKSRNELLVQHINQYKKDQEINEDIINTLRNNNKELLEEILNLREHISKHEKR